MNLTGSLATTYFADEARLHGNGKMPVFDGLAEMRAAIHEAVDTDDPPLVSKLVSARLIEPFKRSTNGAG